MEKTLCKNCANFVVINAETGERVEANHHLRKTGNHIFQNKVGVVRQYVPLPVCHAGKRLDWLDFEPTDEPSRILDTIEIPIDCDDFEVYQPGRGPQQLDAVNTHQAMLDLQQKVLALQEGVFAWRQQQAERDERLTHQIQAIGQVHHNEGMAVAKSEARGTNWQAIGTIAGVVIATLALIVSGIVAWFTIFPRAAG